MTVERYYERVETAAASAWSYDADEAKWAQHKLREEFAATQSDARLRDKLVAAAFMLREAEGQSYRNPDAVGWTDRKNAMAKYGEDVSVFFNIVSARYKEGGSAAQPDLQAVIDKIGHVAGNTPLAIARTLEDLFPAGVRGMSGPIG
jgi:hypothetical protein